MKLIFNLHSYNSSLDIIEKIKDKRETIYLEGYYQKIQCLFKILINKIRDVRKIGENGDHIPIYESIIECDCFEVIEDD